MFMHQRCIRTTLFSQDTRRITESLQMTMMFSILMQVLNAVVERLMDFDEKVRSSAIAAICDAAVKNLQVDPCFHRTC